MDHGPLKSTVDGKLQVQVLLLYLLSNFYRILTAGKGLPFTSTASGLCSSSSAFFSKGFVRGSRQQTDKMDFHFDLAEPLQTHRTNHQRNFSRSLLSNIKFEPRTAEQREADAKRNAPKYAREKAVNSMLTARFAKAKKTFDTYYGYNIDEAFDGDTGNWREERDPWLRIAKSSNAVAATTTTTTVTTEQPNGTIEEKKEEEEKEEEEEDSSGKTTTMEEFLRGYTKGRIEAQKAGVDPDVLTGEELEGLATGVLRVAKVDLAAAGRDNSVVDEAFKRSALEVVAQLVTEYELPQSAPEVEDEEEEEEGEEEVNGVNGV